MIGPALLAPDIIRDVLDGAQSVGFTSYCYKGTALPSDWDGQRQVLASL